jgi:hypothetical protein
MVKWTNECIFCGNSLILGKIAFLLKNRLFTATGQRDCETFDSTASSTYTNRWTNKQNRYANEQTDRKSKQTGRQSNKQTDTRAYKQMVKQTN